MAQKRRTQTNLRLSDEQIEAIEQLRTRGPRKISRERYLRALIDRHIEFFQDEETFDAFEYVRSSEDLGPRTQRCEGVALIDSRRAELTRLGYFERAIGKGLWLDGDVLRQLRDPLIATDLELIVWLWSQGAERVFGHSESEALSVNVLDLLPSDFSRREDMLNVERMRERGFDRVVGVWYAKDGTPVQAECSAQVLFDAAGEPCGFVGVFRETSRE